MSGEPTIDLYDGAGEYLGKALLHCGRTIGDICPECPDNHLSLKFGYPEGSDTLYVVAFCDVCGWVGAL